MTGFLTELVYLRQLCTNDYKLQHCMFKRKTLISKDAASKGVSFRGLKAYKLDFKFPSTPKLSAQWILGFLRPQRIFGCGNTNVSCSWKPFLLPYLLAHYDPFHAQFWSKQTHISALVINRKTLSQLEVTVNTLEIIQSQPTEPNLKLCSPTSVAS